MSAGSLDTKKISLLGGKASDDNLKIFGSIVYSDTRGTDAAIEADFISAMPFSEVSAAPGEAKTELEKKDAFLKVSLGDLIFRGHFLKMTKKEHISVWPTLSQMKIDYSSTSFWSELNYAKSVTDNFSAYFSCIL